MPCCRISVVGANLFTFTTKRPLCPLWFKRDLRLRDHRTLQAAIEATQAVPGVRLLLHIVEPNLVADVHYDLRHWRFITEGLADLNRQLHHISSATSLALGEWPTTHRPT